MVDFNLDRQPDVTDEMQKAAVEAYEEAWRHLGLAGQPNLWGYPLACAIQAALDARVRD